MMKMIVVMTIWSVEYEKSELQPIHLFWPLSLCEPCEHQLIKSLGGLLLFDDSEHLVADHVLGPQPKKLKKNKVHSSSPASSLWVITSSGRRVNDRFVARSFPVNWRSARCVLTIRGGAGHIREPFFAPILSPTTHLGSLKRPGQWALSCKVWPIELCHKVS